MHSSVGLIPLVLMAATQPAAIASPVEPTAPPQPLLSEPASSGAPPSEVGLGTAQVFVGALATVGAGLGVALLAGATHSVPLAIVGLGVAPGAAAATVCGMGKSSAAYEGTCVGAVGGGYIGALALALPLGYLGAVTVTERSPDSAGIDHALGGAVGAILGVIIGTAVGSTIGWHLSKRRRGLRIPAPTAPAPPVVPGSAVLDGWANRQAGPADRVSFAIRVPLLSLAF